MTALAFLEYEGRKIQIQNLRKNTTFSNRHFGHVPRADGSHFRTFLTSVPVVQFCLFFWQSLDSRRVDSVFLNIVKKLQYKQKNLDKNTRGFVTGSKKAKKKKKKVRWRQIRIRSKISIHINELFYTDCVYYCLQKVLNFIYLQYNNFYLFYLFVFVNETLMFVFVRKKK